MKHIILFSLSIFLSFGLLAQDAPDFTITDIDGNTRHLYSELDAGNTVVLKFFTNWCSICNNTAAQVEALWQSYLTNGDEVVFWALDRDANETNTHATTYRDNHSLTFPVIGEAYSVAQLYGVVYQPEYYIICPDRSFIKKTSYTQVDAPVQACLASTSTGIDDLDAPSQVEVAGNTLTWNAANSEKAILRMYDMQGRQVAQLSIQGMQVVALNAIPTGIYLYTLESANEVFLKGKIGLLK